ncbi:hypothetical protein [Streptomyces sp. cg40]|uniref:AraC-like ligand-binding domain-containing protein n=1 Tax=Streptomyces sp. cg40 TaxID=3419764 RepID=UPI003D062F97
MSSITTPRAENSATRLEFWRETVSRTFVPLEIEPREGPDFHARLRVARVGEARVSVVATPPHTARIRRPAGSDASDHVKVSLQLTTARSPSGSISSTSMCGTGGGSARGRRSSNPCWTARC